MDSPWLCLYQALPSMCVPFQKKKKKFSTRMPNVDGVGQPAFSSLAFSAAFGMFTLAEYARYFALYPIGAPLHVFFSEFVAPDKDAGPVVLSHFYLLTGCAGGVWLEGRGIKRFSGLLALGIGDAFVSRFFFFFPFRWEDSQSYDEC
jgi:hypothetical protein